MAHVTTNTVQTFQSKFYIAKADVGMVIGAKGRTINGIKRTHGVDVRIMDSDRADGKQFFLITGSDADKVDAAYQNIDQIAANSERKRQSGANTSKGYGSQHVAMAQMIPQHLQTPPGYSVFMNGFNYIIPMGMMLVPAQVMPQGPSTPQGGYSSVPATPRKNKSGRKVVKRKKSPGPVLPKTEDFHPTVRKPRAVPVMPKSPTYTLQSPTNDPGSPSYGPPRSPSDIPYTPNTPHTPDDPHDNTITDWAAESERTGGEAGGY